MYRGQRYTVACSVLGTPPTKDASYQAANDWWRKKRAEIDGAPLPPSVGGNVLPVDVAELHERIETLKKVPGSAGASLGLPAGALQEIVKLLTTHLGQRDTSGVEKVLGPAGDQSNHQPHARADHTVAAHADAWHHHQQALVAAHQMSAERANNNRCCLEHFRRFTGPTTAVESINAVLLERFYLLCIGEVAARRTNNKKGWSLAYARDIFSVAKGFIRWLAERDTIPLPKNIGNKSFRFGNPGKTVKTWTREDFMLAVEKAPGKLKLALLLMANCGMTQIDVSDLLDSEVDWVEGRITRKRSKTAECDNVPTVCYKLWPLTFELLKKHRSGTERVLLTESGLPYVRKELVEGRYKHADGFVSNFLHLKKRLKLTRSLKELRKTGATLLDGHKDYGRFKSYFLGHSPRTVADRHYATPSKELFDEAVAWLGEQLGQGVKEDRQKAG
jgi:integrase